MAVISLSVTACAKPPSIRHAPVLDAQAETRWEKLRCFRGSADLTWPFSGRWLHHLAIIEVEPRERVEVRLFDQLAGEMGSVRLTSDEIVIDLPTMVRQLTQTPHHLAKLTGIKGEWHDVARMLLAISPGSPAFQDIHFFDYRRHGREWFPHSIEARIGKKSEWFRVVYDEVNLNYRERCGG